MRQDRFLTGILAGIVVLAVLSLAVYLARRSGLNYGLENIPEGVARNYIVAEGPDGLYLIDQHAAHERIMLEKIQNQRASRKVEVQGLLQPVTFRSSIAACP